MEAETSRGTFARRYARMRREQQELEFARIVAVSDGAIVGLGRAAVSRLARRTAKG